MSNTRKSIAVSNTRKSIAVSNTPTQLQEADVERTTPPVERAEPAATLPGRSSRGSRPAVVIDGVSKVYPARRKADVQALNDITLQIGAGEFVSIVGPSGCGKSTLLMALAGLSLPTVGTITLDGSPVTGPSPQMGIAFQRDNLMEWRSVLANVLVQAELRGKKKSAHVDRARELLDMVGLRGFEKSYPAELSGGMRQRVALCRAVLHGPQLLLLDEPFGAVDAMTREQLNADVGRLCDAAGVTAVLVTHDINEAAFMSNRVVVMTARPGRVAGIVDVPGTTPRSSKFRGTQEFLDTTTQIRAVLEGNGEAPRPAGGYS